MNGKLAVVHWNDPTVKREITDLDKIEFAQQINVGWVNFLGKHKVAIVNAITGGDTFEVTLVHYRLITKIQYLEVK